MTTNDAVIDVLDTVAERLASVRCPGVAVAVHAGGEILQATAGMADIDTNEPVTPRTLFGLWSVTKIITAGVLSGLAASGQIDLDAPAADHLPEIATAGQGRAHITIRQLLSHTSGLDGDALADLGDGDDCRQRYVDGLSRIRQLFPPGRAYGYCNAGYILLGALAERVTGRTWEDLAEKMILAPADLPAMTVRGLMSASGPVATAHVAGRNGQIRTTATQYAPWRSCAPIGSSTYATATDLVRFGAQHLSGPGPALPGAAALRQPVVAIPGFEHEQQMSCLGWKSLCWAGTSVLAHDGGAHTFLRVFPEPGVCIAVMCNGPDGGRLAQPLIADLAEATVGIRPPQLPAPTQAPVELDLTAYTGRYDAAGWHAVVTATTGGLAIGLPGRTTEPIPLRHLTGANWMAKETVISFLDPDDTGRSRMLCIAGSRTVVRSSG